MRLFQRERDFMKMFHMDILAQDMDLERIILVLCLYRLP